MWFCIFLIVKKFVNELWWLFFIILFSLFCDDGLLIKYKLIFLLWVLRVLIIWVVLLINGFFLFDVIKNEIDFLWFGCFVIKCLVVIIIVVKEFFILVVLCLCSMLFFISVEKGGCC